MNERSGQLPLLRLLWRTEAEYFAGGPHILNDLRARWGLKPFCHREGFPVFAADDIDAALLRRAGTVARAFAV